MDAIGGIRLKRWIRTPAGGYTMPGGAAYENWKSQGYVLAGSRRMGTVRFTKNVTAADFVELSLQDDLVEWNFDRVLDLLLTKGHPINQFVNRYVQIQDVDEFNRRVTGVNRWDVLNDIARDMLAEGLFDYSNMPLEFVNYNVAALSDDIVERTPEVYREIDYRDGVATLKDETGHNLRNVLFDENMPENGKIFPGEDYLYFIPKAANLYYDTEIDGEMVRFLIGVDWTLDTSQVIAGALKKDIQYVVEFAGIAADPTKKRNRDWELFGWETTEGYYGNSVDSIEMRKYYTQPLILGQDLTASKIYSVFIKIRQLLSGYEGEQPQFLSFRIRAFTEEDSPLGPQWEGDINCVVAAVMNSGAKLTQLQTTRLKQFASSIHDRGCTLEDLPKLESLAKLKIIYKDVLGNTVFRSDKYENSRKKIVLTGHQNHCWSSIPTDIPVIGSTKYIKEGDLMEQISMLPKPFRAWVLQDRFICTFPDGQTILYRTQKDEILCMKTWLKGFTGRMYVDSDDIEEWKDELSASVVNNPTTALGIAFMKWKTDNGIRPISAKFVDQWDCSQVEFRVWHAGLDGLSNVQGGKCFDANINHIDMKSAFLGCGVDGRGYCKKYVSKYGFPGSQFIGASISSIQSVYGLCGVVLIDSWKFNEDVHPYVAGIISGHLFVKGWIPIPLAEFLVESGVVTVTCSRCIISTDRISSLKFPSDRDMGVKFVGKCAASPYATSMIVTDPVEAKHVKNSLMKSGLLKGGVTVDIAGEECSLIKYNGTVRRKQCLHIRSFVLAYCHISLIKMIMNFPVSAVKKICTDAVFVDCPVSMYVVNDPAAGEWRIKKEAMSVGSPWYAEHMSFARVVTPTMFEPLPSDVIGLHSRVFLYGQGGCGKTWRAVKYYDSKAVVLCPTNSLARAHHLTYGVKCMTYHKFFRIGTRSLVDYEGYVSMVEDENREIDEKNILLEEAGHRTILRKNIIPRDEWKGSACTWTGSELGQTRMPSVVIWDECCMVHPIVLHKLLSYLSLRKVKVVLCGDPWQVSGYGIDRDVLLSTIMRWCSYSEEMTVDRRASGCSSLIALKAEMYKGTYHHQRDCIMKSVGMTDFEVAIESWTPSSLWICSTNRDGLMIEKLLIEKHLAKFEGCKMPVRYKPTSIIEKKNQGGDVICFGDVVPECCVGTMHWVDVSHYTSLETSSWVYAGWITVHSAQGRTWDTGNLYLYSGNAAWEENLLYTAVSRLRELSQLKYVRAVGGGPTCEDSLSDFSDCSYDPSLDFFI